MGVCGLGLLLGTFGAKYNPEKPQEKLKTGTSFALLFLTLIYAALAALPAALVVLPLELTPHLIDIGPRLTGFEGIISSLIAFLKYAGIAGLFVIVTGTTGLTLYLTGKRLDHGVQIQIITENK